MTIKAPACKFRKQNLLIYILVIFALACWLGYDGFLNKKFIADHTKNGVADSSLAMNQIGPFILLVVIAGLTVYLFILKSKKIVADDNQLIISKKLAIPYDSIEKIDKTNFNEKGGFFIITYKDNLNNETQLKLSDSKYDNLSAVLQRLVEKLS